MQKISKAEMEKNKSVAGKGKGAPFRWLRRANDAARFITVHGSNLSRLFEYVQMCVNLLCQQRLIRFDFSYLDLSGMCHLEPLLGSGS